MKRYQVIRIHLSPYQGALFTEYEEKLINSNPMLTYRTLDNFKSDQETILITNTHTKLSQIPFELVKNTKLIIHPNSGYDNFSLDEKIWQPIPTVIGHTIRAQAVAEYSLGCIFHGLMNLPQHLHWSKDRKWDRTLLKECPVWIFGYGHIGKIIAKTLDALSLKITVIDPFVDQCPFTHFKIWQETPLEEARIVISAMGLNSTSFHLFNKDFFDHLRSDILFINGARGSLVDEIALKNFLHNNPNSFAFLDVFEKEPFSNDWLGFPQVWKTSHLAGVEINLDQKILQFENAVLTDFTSLKEADFLKKYEFELLQNKYFKGILI